MSPFVEERPSTKECDEVPTEVHWHEIVTRVGSNASTANKSESTFGRYTEPMFQKIASPTGKYAHCLIANHWSFPLAIAENLLDTLCELVLNRQSQPSSGAAAIRC